VEQTPAAMAEALARMRAVLAAPGDGTAPDPAEPEHVLAALTTLRELRGRLAAWEPELITAARELGVSWAGLAPALGVTSRQAAERRYLRLRPSAGGEPTGEGRVQAERDKRAGDRAVARWARENSGELRRLAGQVGALENLAGPARDRVDVVQRALADDDPATLLSPLADAHEHLEATHAHLAEKIRSVTDQTERLRRDTRLNRSRSRSSP
jgi:hypothetical protein